MSLRTRAAKARKTVEKRLKAKRARSHDLRELRAAEEHRALEAKTHPLRSRAGLSLDGDWTFDAGLAAVRDLYREFKELPRANPLRRLIDDWEDDRGKTEYPVPERWHPRYVTVEQRLPRQTQH